MAPMEREKQYDMFDVATGACTLDDYLFQRYSENDLSSTFWIDKKDEVDELRPPKPDADGRPGTEPEVIPIQGPRAKKPESAGPPPPPEGLVPDSVPGPTISDNPLPKAEPPAPQQPQTALADGRDSLSRSAPAETPSLETFQSTPTTPVTGGAAESFVSSAESAATEGATEGTDAPPAPPSMADLLARFHQATRDYQERSLPEQSEDETSET